MGSRAGAVVAICFGIVSFGVAWLAWRYITQYNRWVSRTIMRRRAPSNEKRERFTRWYATGFLILCGLYASIVGAAHL